MAKFYVGQRIRVPSDLVTAPKSLRNRVGIIKSAVASQIPQDFINAHALEDQSEQKYWVLFDFEEDERECGESLLELEE